MAHPQRKERSDPANVSRAESPVFELDDTTAHYRHARELQRRLLQSYAPEALDEFLPKLSIPVRLAIILGSATFLWTVIGLAIYLAIG